MRPLQDRPVDAEPDLCLAARLAQREQVGGHIGFGISDLDRLHRIEYLPQKAVDRTGRVPADLRAQAGAVLAYVVLPLDLFPEAMIGPLGFTDDLLLIALVTHKLLTTVPNEVVFSHWAGRTDLLQTIRELLEVADEMVGKRLWRRIQRLAGGGGQ